MIEVTDSLARVNNIVEINLSNKQIKSLLPEGRSNLNSSHKYLEYQLEITFSSYGLNLNQR
jgi:hypothetical protein